MDHHFDELVSGLLSTQGGNLVSVIVYGSAVTSPGNPRRSDYQLLIVTERLAARDLREIRPVIRWWTEMGYEMPVLITAEEFGDSLDVFPIEFRLMKRAYRTLYGQDLLVGREASKGHLRWQTEHELRGKLLRLRSLALPAGESTDQLASLMTESVVTFVRLIRSIPEIVGEESPIERLATAQRVGEILDIDTSPIVRVLRLRNEPAGLMEVEIQDLFASYLDCITHVIEAVDNL
jgi:predicted nucleotidyltransferase